MGPNGSFGRLVGTSFRVMRVVAGTVITFVMVMGMTSCGDDDSTSTPTGTEAASELQPTDADDAESTETIEPEATTEVSAAPPAQPAGSGSATLTLSNGEVFEFGILCSLEPQEAAGSEILFAVVSYDDPYNLDVTQFAAGSFDGAANISVYDSTSYDTVWEASTLYGTDVELSMAGSTVAGSGEFLAGGELGGETVTGELVANC